jgi:hypothetical protein
MDPVSVALLPVYDTNVGELGRDKLLFIGGGGGIMVFLCPNDWEWSSKSSLDNGGGGGGGGGIDDSGPSPGDDDDDDDDDVVEEEEEDKEGGKGMDFDETVPRVCVSTRGGSAPSSVYVLPPSPA